MSKQYRIAIIGIGMIGGFHARAIADLDNAQAVAGSGLVEKVGKKFEAEYGARYFKDYTEMLDTVKPDIATICTPSGAHLEPALACFERGIHVLCEKPMEINTDRIDQMLAAADKAGVQLGGIFMQRYTDIMQTIYGAARAGRFGSLATVNGYVPWWRDDAYYGPGRWQGTLAMDGGGAMMNQSIHIVDLVQWLAAATMPDIDPDQNPVEEVFAYTGKRSHAEDLIEVEDTAVGVLRFRNGAMGQLLGTTSMYPGSLRRVLLGGRDGMVEILEEELLNWRFRDETPEDDQIRKKFGRTSSTSGGAADPAAIDYRNHAKNIAAFLEGLDGKATQLVTGVEARKTVSIIQAMYESAAKGTPVKPR